MKRCCPKQVVLVRHAESMLNVIRAKSPIFFSSIEERDLFLEIPDHRVELSPEGRMQARETGVALRSKGFSFDSSYDSGYTRTVETLDLIQNELPPGIPRKHSIHIRERETGYAYSMCKAEMDEAFPWLSRYWKTVGPIFARPMGGESVADVITRVEFFLNQMFEEEHERILIVLHGRVLAAARYILEGWTYRELEEFLKGPGPLNCGVTTYERDETTGRLSLMSYNVVYY